MTEQFANFSQSTLTAPINASQTTISVASSATFPALGTFRIVVQSFDSNNNAISAPEIMIVNSVASNTFTVTRGAESTAAIAFASGAQVTHIVTAGVMQALSSGGGSGTVTTVSVASANGLAGTVTNPTTTPAITLSTTVTGLLKGNGTAISAATAGTDYVIPSALNNYVLHSGDTVPINFPVSGAANTPSIWVNGLPFTGGTGSTTVPLFLVGSTAATNWPTTGTMIGANSPSGYAGNLITLLSNNSLGFLVSSTGSATFAGAATIGAASSFTWSGRSRILSGGDGRINMLNNGQTSFSRLIWGPDGAPSPCIAVNASGLSCQIADLSDFSTFKARLIGAASIATAASLNLVPAAAPTSFTDGDVWYDGTHMYGRVAGVTTQLDNVVPPGFTLTTTGTSGAATLTGTVLNIPQYTGGGGSPGGSTTQIQYNSAGSFAGSANLVWDNTNGRLGVNNSTPTNPLTVGSVSVALASTMANAGSAFSSAVAVGIGSENTASSSSTGGAIFGFYSNDGAFMASGDRLGGILGGGSISSTQTANTGAIIFYASEAWSGTARGTKVGIETTANGTTTRSEKITIMGDGKTGFNNLSPNAQVDIISTTAPVRVGYDTSNYYSVAVGSTGAVTYQGAGTGNSFTFNTTGGTVAMLNNTASAVNYWSFYSSASGGNLEMIATGSSTTIGVNLRAKGATAFSFLTASGYTSVQMFTVENAANYIYMGGAVTTGTPSISAVGSDTNINLALAAKGTGAVTVAGDLKISNVGNALYIKEGTNGFQGSVTMVAGVATVTISGLTVNDKAHITRSVFGGTLGTGGIKYACTANTLTITAISTLGTAATTDTSTYTYLITRPA